MAEGLSRHPVDKLAVHGVCEGEDVAVVLRKAEPTVGQCEESPPAEAEPPSQPWVSGCSLVSRCSKTNARSWKQLRV